MSIRNVFVLNVGSSSIKYQVLDVETVWLESENA